LKKSEIDNSVSSLKPGGETEDKEAKQNGVSHKDW